MQAGLDTRTGPSVIAFPPFTASSASATAFKPSCWGGSGGFFRRRRRRACPPARGVAVARDCRPWPTGGRGRRARAPVRRGVRDRPVRQLRRRATSLRAAWPAAGRVPRPVGSEVERTTGASRRLANPVRTRLLNGQTCTSGRVDPRVKLGSVIARLKRRQASVALRHPSTRPRADEAPPRPTLCRLPQMCSPSRTPSCGSSWSPTRRDHQCRAAEVRLFDARHSAGKRAAGRFLRRTHGRARLWRSGLQDLSRSAARRPCRMAPGCHARVA